VTAVGEPQAATGRIVKGVAGGGTGQLVMADRRAVPARQSANVRWASGRLGDDVRASQTCLADGMGVDLDNTRRQVPYNAVVNGRDVTVPAGASKVVPVRVAEGAPYDIRVTDGARVLRFSGRRDCAAGATPVLTAAPDCARGGMAVTVVNEAARDAVYRVNGKDLRVGPKATETAQVPVAEGAEYAIKVAGRDGYARTFEGVRNCGAATKLMAAKSGVTADGGLPVTGAALGGIIAGGIALLGAGTAALVVARRNRRRPAAE
jgi:hypothetical protein